jgi:hypothetical protein
MKRPAGTSALAGGIGGPRVGLVRVAVHGASGAACPGGVSLSWVFRLAATRAVCERALTGVRVHGIGPDGPDGRAEVVLDDGTHVRATPAEVVTE